MILRIVAQCRDMVTRSEEAPENLWPRTIRRVQEFDVSSEDGLRSGAGLKCFTR